ncbi:histidine kinase [Poseidonocella sedimentorum]|uniref:Hpt domain-containing protein n=1 Tax=Poseidonocella sedimentorum TaxID=871652 RepID=A0A1I6D5Y3_9RHOB|nr:histidine kinase [Poseidonocella sedimentorum]SFR00803.1 hypothetical protein SAMN04515673_102226 [Poseidonocella sedimentorum]
MADELIDWARIAELREEFGEDGFSEIVKLFMVEVESGIDALERDVEARAERLHFLKGSALNLGFSAMAVICCDEAPDDETVALVREVFASSRDAFFKGCDVAGTDSAPASFRA